jgi:hypothetical protein
LVAVPPKIAAKIPSAIAPYKPAVAPRPDCTPKANANGNATTPATMPPIRSPLKFLLSYFKLIISIYFKLKEATLILKLTAIVFVNYITKALKDKKY